MKQIRRITASILVVACSIICIRGIDLSQSEVKAAEGEGYNLKYTLSQPAGNYADNLTLTVSSTEDSSLIPVIYESPRRFMYYALYKPSAAVSGSAVVMTVEEESDLYTRAETLLEGFTKYKDFVPSEDDGVAYQAYQEFIGMMNGDITDEASLQYNFLELSIPNYREYCVNDINICARAYTRIACMSSYFITFQNAGCVDENAYGMSLFETKMKNEYASESTELTLGLNDDELCADYYLFVWDEIKGNEGDSVIPKKSVYHYVIKTTPTLAYSQSTPFVYNGLDLTERLLDQFSATDKLDNSVEGTYTAKITKASGKEVSSLKDAGAYTVEVTFTPTEADTYNEAIASLAVTVGKKTPTVKADIPSTGIPYFKGDNGKEGWEAIQGQLERSPEGNTIIIEMNGSTTLPKAILQSLKGKDATLVLDLGNGITWNINGESITDSSLNDIDLDITLDTDAISAELINQIAGEQSYRTFSLAYDGPFGFTSVLTIDMDKINAGKYGNLYYYDPETKQLILQAIGKIGERGSVELPFSYASDYVVIISEEPMLEKTLEQMVISAVKGKLYVGGRVKKSMTLKLKLPQILKEAVEKDSSILKVAYQSSNPKVATVTASGKITAKKVGKATVTTMVTINGVEKKFQTEITVSKELSSDYLNSTLKYLYIGEKGTKTYDFNIKKDAMEKGATYTWYVKEDKGNPDSVTINKKTGEVTAKEAGTAYIRCKITLSNGTILRPEARVIVRNNITKVEISNIPKDSTIIGGLKYDFNRTILDTAAGKGEKTQGIIRWEIRDDTAGVITATDKGIVLPYKVGTFKIRAVSFQSKEKYNLWFADKEVNERYVKAKSEWTTIKVTRVQ